MFDLSGKRALVTGATGGLGGSIAKMLHAQGAHVALSGTRAEKLEGLATELGERAVVTPCNLSDGEAVDALPKQAAEALGGSVDILVANAGITRDGLLMRMKQEDWDLVQKVNLEAYFRLSKAWVNTIAPGFIRSPMTDELNEAQTAATLSKIPAGDLGTGDDIAAAALYLASNEANYVTGQTLHVNGGMAMI